MKILLVYPEYPNTFWSFKYALRFISKKASSQPLGLLTVAAMLPESWEKRLIDMNVKRLGEKDLQWADMVFISAMSIQRESARKVIERCKGAGITVVAGGPLFTSEWEAFSDVDHLVLDEAELTLSPFLADFEHGRALHVYRSDKRADLTATPIPLWDVISLKNYASINIQYSRGCPFDCEFCNITVLYGRVPRTKSKEQTVRELESLYRAGWRGGVFFVDDNFIGNKLKLKKEILPAIAEWMEKRGHPFVFNTEASVNLADDPELMRLMVQAGFDTVFVGIETPNETSLIECNKPQNRRRDLVSSVKAIQQSGLQVQGGFIVGFDSDPPTIFERTIKFIQETGIVTAMVGMLNAPRGTKLYERMRSEGRLLSDMSGDNLDLSMNFVPRMNKEALVNGYRRLIATIYSPKPYYDRMKSFLREYKPNPKRPFKFSFRNLNAFARSVVLIGVIGRERLQYWRLFFWSLFTRPRLLPLTVTLAIYGFHFRRIAYNIAASSGVGKGSVEPYRLTSRKTREPRDGRGGAT
jgi:radical SAM superfamily enzyme YgiQ (UPF0313 family)